MRSKARGGVGTHDRRNRSAAGPFQGPSCPILHRCRCNAPTATTLDLPSAGSKGGLLLVDSHFDPLRHRGFAASRYTDDHDDPDSLENFPARVNVSDVAFTRWDEGRTHCFAADGAVAASPPTRMAVRASCTRYGRRRAVPKFTDALGWYPGIEARGAELFFRDIDGSVVIPSLGNQLYSTRVVDADGDALAVALRRHAGGWCDRPRDWQSRR